MNVINKAGAIIFDKYNRVLAVHKVGKPAKELIVPGGKIEIGENHENALRRELKEELSVEVISFEKFGIFEAEAIYEPSHLIMHVYTVTISGLPTPSNEIDELVWLDKNFDHGDYIFASILGKQLLPLLRSKNLLGEFLTL